MLTVESPVSEAERIQFFQERTYAKLDGIRCPLHHLPPKLQFNGRTLREMTISMSGCCQRLIEIANKAIAC